MNFEAILFDCDGVLVDSETITHQVLRKKLGEAGWQLSLDECMRIFIGKMVRDEAALIERMTGQPLTDAWMNDFRTRRNDALERELEAIPGATAAVAALHAAYGGRIACASGADRPKIELQLRKVGLFDLFASRIFSGQEMARSKPAPDVYLAAAAALGVDPRHCAVIEDTPTGVAAGVAAGATVFGFSPGGPSHGSAESLKNAGAATVFADMAALPAVLAAWQR
ncbi:HAD family phosphatase [Paucibacter sp. R3-3]|uniref:HAD family phosphatase n=1 Tax=Roseateles agri TaxID=3098619 RepID=A0ABU5DEB3_9BURK|nr:HAD family phosphatase [Paucibacter sp. R3-3]MDY0743487.1 HAD family phosphatase [Paucibacter sp. R3-3]